MQKLSKNMDLFSKKEQKLEAEADTERRRRRVRVLYILKGIHPRGKKGVKHERQGSDGFNGDFHFSFHTPRSTFIKTTPLFL